MKLMGYEVDKVIKGCKIIFCKDDEMSWAVVTPRNDAYDDIHNINRFNNDEKIFLWLGNTAYFLTAHYGYISGKIQEINCEQEYIKVNDENIPANEIVIVGIVGNDDRP